MLPLDLYVESFDKEMDRQGKDGFLEDGKNKLVSKNL